MAVSNARIHLDRGDDPEVFHFEEGDEEPRRVFRHFTDWLAACVNDESAAHDDVHPRS